MEHANAYDAQLLTFMGVSNIGCCAVRVALGAGHWCWSNVVSLDDRCELLSVNTLELVDWWQS